MQTVNFQCGHCGKLMAVGVEFLGQQVRCPHCQQVVIAPAANVHAAPAPAPAPFPALEPPPAPAPPENLFGSLTTDQPGPPDDPFRTFSVNANEDIFNTRKEPEDALFGESDAPRLEIPRDIVPSAPSHAFDMPLETTSANWPPAPETTRPIDSMAPPSGDGLAQEPGIGAQEPEMMPWSPINGTPAAPTSPLDGAQQEMGAMSSPSVRKLREESARINWFIPLIFLPLVLYAILATVGCAILYMRIQAQAQTPSLWEQFPDVDGDTPGARPRPKGGVNLRFKREDAIKPLPEKLHVKLGETLRLGDLEVTPMKVRRDPVKILTEGFPRAEPLAHDSLVLTLQFRNLSDTYAFTPLDNYFDRHWDGNKDWVPLTVLAAGTNLFFFGGPARWVSPTLNERSRERREWVVLPGRKNIDRQGLAPGESTEACVCTDGTDPAVAAYLFGIDEAGKRGRNPYSGKLLWRVQVRRGQIDYNGMRRPAVAVIGVEFTSKDYAN
jgi:hypothetical protein